ncbi:MAG: hypothetical protein OXG65_02730 [Chloroflexi bacterium]|nr:hypothetical protein [Chloroflexota bacterium]
MDRLPPPSSCYVDGWVSTRFRIREASVAWRPDGSEVVFSRAADIYAAAQDGRELRTLAQVWPVAALTEPSYTTTTFSFAPNGSMMIYATCEFVRLPGPSDLHELSLLDVDRPDAGPRRLTSNEVIEYYPAWSPDGQRVAYLRGLRHEAHAVGRFDSITPGALFVMAADGTGTRSVPGGEALIGPPRWSPDGRWLAFLNDDGEAGLGLYVVNAEGTVGRRLADAGSEVSWSPDSRQLAFVQRDGQYSSLYAITVTAADAAEPRLLARIYNDVSGFNYADAAIRDWETSLPLVAWSPAGTHIVYECQYRRLCIFAPDGDQYDEPSLYGQAVAWSRDGSRLAVVIVEPAISVWQWLAYQSVIERMGDDRTIRVYTVAPDGSDLRPLVREHEDGGLVAAAAA